MSVAIIAALPREIAGLVRGHTADPDLKARGVYLYRRGNATIVAAGMGANRVTLAVDAAITAGDTTSLVSVGLAGSCQPAVKPGSLVRAGLVIDGKTGERFATSDVLETNVLVSTTKIASLREKARLHAAYAAAMVDMEAATVARLARALDLPLQAIKGISDPHDFEIDSLARFADPLGQFQTARFAAHVAVRPRTWKAAMELGRNSSAALKRLDEALLALINTI